jgi:hypothetical protein
VSKNASRAVTDPPLPRLRPWTALCLWWAARADARAGLPATGTTTTGTTTTGEQRAYLPPTPCLQELDRRRLEIIEGERTRLVEDTAELVVRRRTLSARIDQACGRLREETEARHREQLRLRLGELHYALADLDERIVRECVSAQSRAVRHDEYLRRCCARYARTLLRRHPAAAELARAGWPALGALPGWVSDPTAPATLLPGAVPVDGQPAVPGRTGESPLSRAGAR